MGKIAQIFVAFVEKLNFNNIFQNHEYFQPNGF